MEHYNPVMRLSRSARWWASLLTLLALLVTTGTPAVGAREGDAFLGEICSVAASAAGERGDPPSGHSGDATSPHCGACPSGLAALVDLFPSLWAVSPTLADGALRTLSESPGHGGLRPRSDSPPRAPPLPSVA